MEELFRSNLEQFYGEQISQGGSNDDPKTAAALKPTTLWTNASRSMTSIYQRSITT